MAEILLNEIGRSNLIAFDAATANLEKFSFFFFMPFQINFGIINFVFLVILFVQELVLD